MWQKYLSTCPEQDRLLYEEIIRECGSDWAALQRAFVKSTDEYLDVELQKPVDATVGSHEAGGQFRIAFPHLMVRPRKDVEECMKNLMECRRKHTLFKRYHGYVNCHEVHHEIETFIYYQNGLVYYQLPGKETALESIFDFAEHLGNWAEGVPDWYDWDAHGFTSIYLGTRDVRNYPPYDYQEANHFRFLSEAVVAYLETKEQKYMDLILDYTNRWCEFVEAVPEHGLVRTHILPEHAMSNFKETNQNDAEISHDAAKYTVFYCALCWATMIDLVNAFLNAYILTGNERYVRAAEKCMDQCFDHSDGIRPAVWNEDDQWKLSGSDFHNDIRPVYEGKTLRPFCDEEFYFTKALMRYTRMTGSMRYKDAVLRWANDVNDDENEYDQMGANLFVLAHYMDGDEKWLARAYDHALRLRAMTENDDFFHQCEQNRRQGSKVAVELLYSVMLGDSTFTTRGEMPDPMFRYEMNGVPGLNDNVAIRIWFKGEKEYNFEVKNLSSEDAEIHVHMYNGNNVKVILAGEETNGVIKVPGNASVKGIFHT